MEADNEIGNAGDSLYRGDLFPIRRSRIDLQKKKLLRYREGGVEFGADAASAKSAYTFVYHESC